MLGCDGTSPGATATPELSAAGRSAALREAFRDLPPSGQRRPLLLCEYPPGPEAEMSAGLGIPADSTASSRRRGLDKLRRHPVPPGLIDAVTTTADDVHGPGSGAARVISGPLPASEVTVNRIHRVRLTPALGSARLDHMSHTHASPTTRNLTWSACRAAMGRPDGSSSPGQRARTGRAARPGPLPWPQPPGAAR